MAALIIKSSLVTMLQFQYRVLYRYKTVVIRSDIPKHYNIIVATHSVASRKKVRETYFLTTPRIFIQIS